MALLLEARKRVRDALELARVLAESSHMGFKHGAVLFRRGSVVGMGANGRRPAAWAMRMPGVPAPPGREGAKREAGMHAEIACMNRIRAEDIRGSDVAVARVLANGELAFSKPCENCERVMISKGVRRCYFSINEEEYGELRFP